MPPLHRRFQAKEVEDGFNMVVAHHQDLGRSFKTRGTNKAIQATLNCAATKKIGSMLQQHHLRDRSDAAYPWSLRLHAVDVDGSVILVVLFHLV